MAPTLEWKKWKQIIEEESAIKKLKSLDYKSLKNVRNKDGKGLLHVAAKRAFIDVSQYLINVGCEVNLQNGKNGLTPLTYILHGNEQSIQKIVQLLVKCGADLSWGAMKDHFGVLFKEKKKTMKTLCDALKQREGGPKHAAEYLLSNGWSLENIACLQNDPTTMWAIKKIPHMEKNYKKLLSAVTAEDVVEVNQILKSLVHCHSKKIMSWALLEASKIRSLESPVIIKLLLEEGAPVNGFPGEKKSPLIEALIHRNVDNAWVLLNYGAKLEKKMITGLQNIQYPLLETAEERKAERIFAKNCIRILFEQQGVCNCEDSKFDIVKCLISFYREKFDISVSLHICVEYKLMQRHLMGLEYDEIVDTFHCSDELRKIKNFKVEECISLWDLLKKTIDEITPFTRNEKLMNIVIAENFINQFPLYGKTLQFKAKKALEKRLLIDQSVDVLGNYFPKIKSCSNVLKKIISYVPVPDLLILKENVY